MKTKFLLLLSIMATATAFAQTGSVNTNINSSINTDMPPGERPPMRPKDFREERREDIQNMRGEMKDAKMQFKEDMKERKGFLMGSTTGSATPTPWRNLKENVKDIRKEYMGDRKEDRKDFREERREDMMRARPISATATAAIAAKLGITTEALQAQLASGTKLKELVKDKISPQEMSKIMPPRIATFTRAVEERGFFNQIRSRIFGPKEVVVKAEVDAYGEVNETETDEQTQRPFWKRFFGF